MQPTASRCATANKLMDALRDDLRNERLSGNSGCE
jgi:hypothetical protein